MATKILGRRGRAPTGCSTCTAGSAAPRSPDGDPCRRAPRRPVHPLQPRERVRAVRVVVASPRGHVRRRQPLSPACGRAHLTRRSPSSRTTSGARSTYASFPLFVTATVHGLTAGTDSRVFVSLVCMFAVSGLVIFLTALRLMHCPAARPVAAGAAPNLGHSHRLPPRTSLNGRSLSRREPTGSRPENGIGARVSIVASYAVPRSTGRGIMMPGPVITNWPRHAIETRSV